MFFNNPIVEFFVLVGGIFIIVGMIMMFFPPKNINHLYGYRTRNSMKSQERWDFAQKFSAKELIKSGVALLLLGFLAFFLNVETTYAIGIGIVVMIMTVAILLFRVERKLIDKFDNSN